MGISFWRGENGGNMEEYMGYEKYRTALLGALKEKFGDRAVTVRNIYKNNDTEKEAFCIRPEGETDGEGALVYPGDCYRDYMECGISLKQCVEGIIDTQNQMKQENIFSRMKYKLTDWGSIKSEIYPMLLSTELNQKSLEGMVRRKWMDLSIVYAVRLMAGEGCCCHVKITKQMLESYGVSVKELHKQALLNMKMDGYGFCEIEDMILNLSNAQKEAEKNIEPVSNHRSAGERKKLGMLILTNSLRMFGAAGVLDWEFLKNKLGEKDYYMLPSSVHETIFVPAVEGADWKALNCMVREVNEKEVSEEERLSDHCYFYEGKTGELRSCA